MARTGRRPGRSGARETILAAARASFAERGYDGTTIRGVAAKAGVDPALVQHYFGPKDELFAASLELPRPPAEALEDALHGAAPDQLGERIVGTFLSVWDGAGGRPLLALLRSASSNERAAMMLREFVAREITSRIASRLGTRDAELRASLAASQLMGLGMARHVFRIEPLASAPRERVVAAVAPGVQRFLTGELGERK